MALTTTWKGQLKISLVSFPVRLYTAVGSPKKLALNQLHKQCRSRIHLDTFCPKHGKLARSEITKGYEYEKGKYITIEQEDLQKIKLESTRTIEVIQFVNQSELDPVYIDAVDFLVARPSWLTLIILWFCASAAVQRSLYSFSPVLTATVSDPKHQGVYISR